MNRYLPAIIFFVTAVIGLGMTMLVRQASTDARETQFELVAEDAVDRIANRINEHIALLSTTRALFEVGGGAISRDRFTDFVSQIFEDGHYGGIQGMGFARLVPVGHEGIVEAELAKNYKRKIPVRPETTAGYRTPIVLLEPDDARNRNALGYDMFSQTERREAMEKAVESGRPTASAPVELVQEITAEKQAGFLVYLAVERSGSTISTSGDPYDRVSGFVYAPFRSGDLHDSVLSEDSRLPLVLSTSDVTDGSERFLYKSPQFDERRPESRFEINKTAEIAGRTWNFRIVDTAGFSAGVSPVGSFLIASLSLLFAGALAASTRSQIKRLEVAEKLAKQETASANRSDLMLQEMKHRIKNHISRIQAISRQTAASSATLDEYVNSFSTRLQALANAQDVLSRSQWQRADLYELVQKELEQVFGARPEKAGFTGPNVELSERQAQAMSLVMHELATNALKYGEVTAEGGNLSVLWELTGSRSNQQLRFSWIEKSAKPAVEPEKTGFGSRLMDASIRGELNGTIERQFTESGLIVVLTFPMRPSSANPG